MKQTAVAIILLLATAIPCFALGDPEVSDTLECAAALVSGGGVRASGRGLNDQTSSGELEGNFSLKDLNLSLPGDKGTSLPGDEGTRQETKLGLSMLEWLKGIQEKFSLDGESARFKGDIGVRVTSGHPKFIGVDLSDVGISEIRPAMVARWTLFFQDSNGKRYRFALRWSLSAADVANIEAILDGRQIPSLGISGARAYFVTKKREAIPIGKHSNIILPEGFEYRTKRVFHIDQRISPLDDDKQRRVENPHKDFSPISIILNEALPQGSGASNQISENQFRALEDRLTQFAIERLVQMGIGSVEYLGMTTTANFSLELGLKGEEVQRSAQKSKVGIISLDAVSKKGGGKPRLIVEVELDPSRMEKGQADSQNRDRDKDRDRGQDKDKDEAQGENKDQAPLVSAEAAKGFLEAIMAFSGGEPVSGSKLNLVGP